jgi:hypothetical protein
MVPDGRIRPLLLYLHKPFQVPRAHCVQSRLVLSISNAKEGKTPCCGPFS